MHRGRAAERIEVHRLLHDKCQTVDALPEVRRACGHIDAQPAGRGDHGDDARIARIVLVNCASSMSADTRRIMPSTTSSILHDFVLALRFFGRRKDEPSSARRPPLRTSAPLPSQRAKPEPRPSTSYANRRPASVSPHTGAQHRQHARQAPGFPPRSAPVPPRSETAGHTDPRGSPYCQQSRQSSRPILSHPDRRTPTNSFNEAGGDRRSACEDPAWRARPSPRCGCRRGCSPLRS